VGPEGEVVEVDSTSGDGFVEGQGSGEETGQ